MDEKKINNRQSSDNDTKLFEKILQLAVVNEINSSNNYIDMINSQIKFYELQIDDLY